MKFKYKCGKEIPHNIREKMDYVEKLYRNY